MIEAKGVANSFFNRRKINNDSSLTLRWPICVKIKEKLSKLHILNDSHPATSVSMYTLATFCFMFLSLSAGGCDIVIDESEDESYEILEFTKVEPYANTYSSQPPFATECYTKNEYDNPKGIRENVIGGDIEIRISSADVLVAYVGAEYFKVDPLGRQSEQSLWEDYPNILNKSFVLENNTGSSVNVVVFLKGGSWSTPYTEWEELPPGKNLLKIRFTSPDLSSFRLSDLERIEFGFTDFPNNLTVDDAAPAFVVRGLCSPDVGDTDSTDTADTNGIVENDSDTATN